MAQPRAWLGPELLGALGLAELRGALTPPCALEGERLRLDLAPNATGAHLARVVRFDGSESFAFELEPAPERGYGPGLWRIAGTHATEDGPTPAGLVVLGGSLQAGEATYTVGPDTAARFQLLSAIGTAGESALLLLWEEVAIPKGGSGDVLWVAASITLADHDEVSRWRIAVLREEGRHTASLDRVEFPILACKGPVRPRPFESHRDAQRYARLLVPTALQGMTPFHGGNEPFWFWVLTQVEREFYHPSAAQLLQLSALYAGDPEDAASWRRMLYVGSEDSAGHYKRFRHAGIQKAGSAGLEGHYGWAHVYVPPFADWQERPEQPPPSEFGNTFAAPYPVVVGALLAKSDAYWYDACAFYREFVARSGMVPERLDRNESLGFLRRGRPWFGFLAPTANPVPKGALYARYLELARAWRQALENPHQPTRPALIHLQTYVRGLLGTTVYPDRPVPPHLDDGLPEMVKEANDDGFRVAVYHRSWHDIGIGSGWDELLPPEAYLYDRQHRARKGIAPARIGVLRETFWLDLGAPANWRLTAETIDAEIASAVGVSGFYQDLVSGTGAQLSYDPPPPLRPSHAAHGGSYWSQGKIAATRLARAALRRQSPFAGDGEDKEVVIFSEGPEEFLAGHMDLTQESYFWLPHHLQLAEEMLYGFPLPGMPPETRDMSVSFWSLVYHEWAVMGRQLYRFSRVGLATARQYPIERDGVLYDGMTAEEWTDAYAFTACSCFAAGIRHLIMTDLTHDEPMIELEEGVLTVDRTKDPEATGLAIWALLRRLHEAQASDLAGPFVVHGRMERPLRVCWDSPLMDLATNPIAACRKTDPRDWSFTFPILYDELSPVGGDSPGWAMGSRQFQVQRVLHAMWRDGVGRLGLVLVGWSGRPSGWIAELDPALYGLDPSAGFTASELRPGEAPRPLGRFFGRIDVRCDDAPVVLGGDLHLGPVAPRAVRMIVFEPL